MSEVVVTQAHRGKAIAAQVGDMLVVQLPENPTTGFRWAIEDGQTVVAPEGDSFALAGEPAMGQGGVHSFRFRVASAGRADLHFRLGRSWEPAGSALDRFDFTVNALG